MFPLIHALCNSTISSSFESYYMSLSPTYAWLMNETSGGLIEEVGNTTEPFTSTSIIRGEPGLSTNSSPTEYSYLFNGSPDSYQQTGVADTFSGSGDFTIAFCFKMTDYTVNKLNVFCGSSISSSQPGFYIGYDNRNIDADSVNTLKVYISEGAVKLDVFSANGAIVDNNEHIAVVVKNGSIFYVYLDGVLLGTEAIQVPIFADGNDFLIGTANDGTGTPSTSFTPSANIDTVGVWVGEAKDGAWVLELSNEFFS